MRNRIQIRLSYFVWHQSHQRKTSSNLQRMWISRSSAYKSTYQIPFVPFLFFVKFIQDISAIKNDPVFINHNVQDPIPERNNNRDLRKVPHGSATVFIRKRYIGTHNDKKYTFDRCPIHTANYAFSACRTFIGKSIDEKKQFLKENIICYKCCRSNEHMARNCNGIIKREKCGVKCMS